MDTLEEYLATEFALDEEHLAAVDQLINEAAETLINSLQRNGWPYRVSRSQAETSKVSMSHSTLAMVSLSLWKLGGAWKKPLPLGPLPSFPPIKVRDLKALTETATKATELLIKAIVKHRAVKTKSKTYGDNDPVTLFFLAELSHVAGSPGGEIYWRHVRSYLKRRTSQLRRAANGDALQKQERLYIKLKDHEAVSNAMIPLRIVQALRLCRNGIEQDIPTFREYFETTLHDQLSYSAIPDSRFDPAELAFCLEGLLLSQRNAVDRGLFRRVFEVLKKAQEESAFWRPVKPFMATVKGMALFPVSVEVANSLIRSCEIFDGIDLHDTFGSHYIGLFHRYWQWVKARTVRFRKRDSEIVGWHSEHVNEIGAIHAWETSQVLEFLMAFRRLIQTHVARRTLTMSRFSVRDPEHPDGRAPLWTEICAKYEPVGSLGREYKVYSRIGSDFVFGWRDVEPLHYSMLL